MPDEKLTPKMLRFCEAYLGDARFNATEAARLARYKGNDVTLASVGYENLRKPQIKAYISKRFQESAMSSDENLMHIAEIARGVYGPGFFLTETTETVKDDNGIEIQVKRIGVNWPRVKEYGRLIKSLTFTNFGPRIELHDRVRNLELIGRSHGLFIDKTEHSGPNGGPVQHQFTEVIVELPPTNEPVED
jgi:phage terminase small subunit